MVQQSLYLLVTSDYTLHLFYIFYWCYVYLHVY